jgi:hypothetical protein
VNAEGWYLDPYGLHVDRWFSDGHPTGLVRDDGVTSQDQPPSTSHPGPLTESANAEPRGDDLKRADARAAGGSFDSRKAVNSAIDAGYAGGGFMLGTGSAPVRQKRRPGRRLVDFAADILWRWP